MLLYMQNCHGKMFVDSLSKHYFRVIILAYIYGRQGRRIGFTVE